MTTEINRLNAVIREHFPYIEEARPSDVTSFAHAPMQRLIMLDRYSLKDFSLQTLADDDLVVVTIKDDPKFPRRGYGHVASISGDGERVSVKLDEYFDGGDVIERPREWVDKPLEWSLEQIARRVARGVAQGQYSDEMYIEIYDMYVSLLSSLDLVPGGRIDFGAGNPANVTWINCFVVPSPKDSLEGIAEHALEHMKVMQKGGGIGSNMSTLRPLHSRVMSVNGKSSGAVSWMHYVAQLTHLIQQGGSRRGAQMKILNDTHPEVILFALCKIQSADRLRQIAAHFADYPLIAEVALNLASNVDPNFLTGANISVFQTDEFRHAVDNDEDWTFLFPDIENYTPEQKERYDSEWHETGGDVFEWQRRTGYALKEYGTIPARVLSELFDFCAWGSAEPGVLFISQIQRMSNSHYYAILIATNPCGEQPLPAYAMCTLAHSNWANMYDETADDVAWERLRLAIHGGVRFLDDVIDGTPLPLPQIEKMAMSERRIGLGIVGAADLFIKLRLPYGSPEMLAKLEEIMRFFRDESYRASIELAKERGPFPLFDADKYLEGGFIKTLPDDIRADIARYGIRNVCVNTIAPVGTKGSMLGISTGGEPYYAFKYYRSGRMGQNLEVNVEIAQQWFDENPDATELPPWFVSAMDIPVERHADVQAIMQRYIDSACSKTCNAPNSMTVEEVSALHAKAHRDGCKGITIYRDGSRFEQVLSTTATGAETAKETAPEFDENAMEATQACAMRFENGQLIKECS